MAGIESVIECCLYNLEKSVTHCYMQTGTMLTRILCGYLSGTDSGSVPEWFWCDSGWLQVSSRIIPGRSGKLCLGPDKI